MPLIGFAGAPFTLASYAIEGGHSNNFAKTKSIMYGHPESWHELCALFAEVIGEYLVAQIEAGVDVVQVFDSWVGALNARDYREFILPHTKRIFEIVSAKSSVPTIHFGVGTWSILAEMREAGGDVIGADWRTPLDEAWDAHRLRPRHSGQPRPDAAARPDRPPARRSGRCAGASGRPTGTHLQPRSRHSAADAARARPGARALRAPTHGAMTTGVLLMAHGTPSSMDEMPEYLKLVRGGRPASPELVAEMRHNYEAIGGRSPLTELTLAQGAALHGPTRSSRCRLPSACATGTRF